MPILQFLSTVSTLSCLKRALNRGIHSVHCFSVIPFIHCSRRWALSYWVTWMMFGCYAWWFSRRSCQRRADCDEVGHEVGLDLNISKCELIWHPGCVVTDPTLQSFLQLPVSDAELLGVLLFPGAVLDTAWFTALWWPCQSSRLASIC